MKHFLKRFPPGADRFQGVRTYPANGSPPLSPALSYMGAEITSRTGALGYLRHCPGSVSLMPNRSSPSQSW